MSRPFASAHLAQDPAARAFLPDDARDPAVRSARVRVAASRAVAPALLDELRRQQQVFAPSPAREAHLAALAAGGTAVVVTGQQVGLFLGPLYGFYKAASAIAVARALTAETGVRCVPLFWLQTEDHDFAEIASAAVLDRDGARVVLRMSDPASARVSLAHRCLGPELDDLLASLAEALPEGPAAAETLALLRRGYRAGRPIPAAFAETMAALFAEEGLLVFDPRREPVAALAAPVYARALAEAPALEGLLTARAAALEAAGFATQIEARPGCALLFFHREASTGPRYRLQRKGDGGAWTLAGCEGEVVSDEALTEALAHAPLRFSTSALLRPIVQDTLWPTVAYVGGPGELNYFAQLGPLYDHFGLAPPWVVLRGRFRCLDARTRRLLAALGLAADELALPRDALLERLATRALGVAPAGEVATAAPPLSPAGAREEATRHLHALNELVARLEGEAPALARAAARTRGTLAHAVGRLVARYTHELATRDAVTGERLARLEIALAPDGVPQERAYAWPSLAGRLGPAALKALVMSALDADPFATHLRELLP